MSVERLNDDVENIEKFCYVGNAMLECFYVLFTEIMQFLFAENVFKD